MDYGLAEACAKEKVLMIHMPSYLILGESANLKEIEVSRSSESYDANLWVFFYA